MVKNRADLINSDGQAHELLSNIIPSEVKVHIKQAVMVRTLKKDISRLNLPKSSKAKNTNKKCNTEKKNNTNEAHESFNY